MKTTKEIIAIMRAYADGKKIEYKGADGTPHIWVENDVPSWNWARYDYRIKPEPKYRPYKNADECFAEVLKHGGWIKHPTTEMRMFIIWVNPNHIISGENIFEFAEMVESYVWADDGTPCGILEEE